MKDHDHWEEIRRFFSDDDGSSPEKAVRINMLLLPEPSYRHSLGLRLECAWIERHYPGAAPAGQKMPAQGRGLDALVIILPSGEKKTVYFEISTFFSPEHAPPGAGGRVREAPSRLRALTVLAILASALRLS
jgi:hypothetical protein